MVLSVRSVRINMKNETRLPAGSQGFTIIEVLVVLSIFITLLRIGYVSVLNFERKTPITATVNTVIADIRGQQTKAMTGVDGSSFGIFFQTNGYTLFKGDSYNPSDPANAVTPLPTNITFSPITFPSNVLVFTKGSGEIAGFSSATNSIAINQNLTGEHKTFTINRYGAITSLQ